MPNLLTWHVGNQNPSITETITVGGAPFNLSASTVQFRMRESESSTLKVNSAATITDAVNGGVRYDWSATDLDTPGMWHVWWVVTTGGKTQDMGEAIIQILSHAPVSRDYVELEDLKKTLSLDGLSFADLDVKDVITSASRKVDEICERRFWADADALQVRIYSPAYSDHLRIDDLVTLTSLKTDPDGDGTYEETWVVNSDFVLEPLNAAADSEPWTSIRAHPTGDFYFPTAYPRSVQVTGKFGWNAVPAEVRTATKMIAHRYLKRMREAPFAVVGFGLDGASVRVPTADPDVMDLLAPFMRRVLVA